MASKLTMTRRLGVKGHIAMKVCIRTNEKCLCGSICDFLLVLLVLSFLSLPIQGRADEAQEILSQIPGPLTAGRPIAIQTNSEVFVHRPARDGSVDSRHIKTISSYVRDGDRFAIHQSGQVLDEKNQEIPEHSTVSVQLFLNSRLVDATKYGDQSSYFGLLDRASKEAREQRAAQHETGAFLSGQISPEMYIPELLARAPRLRPDLEIVNSVPCYVLEATTEQGEITAWVSQEKGKGLLKYILRKTGEHPLRDKLLKSSDIEEWTFEVEVTEFETHGGEYFPISGSYKQTATFTDGRKQEVSGFVELTELDLEPDFEGMGAFLLDIPDGTILDNRDGGLRYEVMNGEVIPYVSRLDLVALEEGIADIAKQVSPVPSPLRRQAENQAQQSQFARSDEDKGVAIAGILCGMGAVFLICMLLWRRSAAARKP